MSEAPGGRPGGGPGVVARRPRTALRLAAALLGAAALVAAWGAGFAWFAASMPQRVDDPWSRTDAIVVLTGGAGRLDVGLELLAAGRAAKLFVTGVDRAVDMAELLRISEKTPEAVACCIDLGHEARDTAGNAAETAQWLETHGFRSLRLVTADYHMRRSLLEFRRAMPEAALIPHPVLTPQLQHGRWWRPRMAIFLAREYNKYLVARLRHGLGLASRPAPGAPPP